MNIATITAGAINGSTSVSIQATGIANGTAIVVTRGEWFLGSGVVASQLATVTVPPLATGDIIQASVTLRGNQSGLPVRVEPADTMPSGWVGPTSITVTNADGSTTTYDAAGILSAFGEHLGAVYDPLGARKTRIAPEYLPLPPVELGFDVMQVQQAGSTVLRVVPRNTEALLVGWNGATPSSSAPLTLTASATITVSVQRDDQIGVTLTRSLSVVVLPAPTFPATPAAGDITSACWRNYGHGYIRSMVNCLKPCEAQLIGYAGSAWSPGIMREAGFQEIDWSGPVPIGTYTCNNRVIGETNPANYYSFIITVV